MQEFYKPISASEAEEIRKKRIAFLSSRATGMIPIIDFIHTHDLSSRVQYGLLYGLNEGWFYYMDDITKKRFISAPKVGKKIWIDLLIIIKESLLKGEYPEYTDALNEYFTKQNGYPLFNV